MDNMELLTALKELLKEQEERITSNLTTQMKEQEERLTAKMIALNEETRKEACILNEETRKDIRVIAEGHEILNRKLDAISEDVSIIKKRLDHVEIVARVNYDDMQRLKAIK